MVIRFWIADYTNKTKLDTKIVCYRQKCTGNHTPNMLENGKVYSQATLDCGGVYLSLFGML